MASMAFIASLCWGSRSIASSTMLQSPSIMSICMLFVFSYSVFQKLAFSVPVEDTFGAYMARMFILELDGHSMVRRRAWPGIRFVTFLGVLFIKSLLIMMATPLEHMWSGLNE